MKNTKILMILGAFFLSLSIHSFAQIELPEVTVKAVKYKYLTAVNQKDAALPVKILQQRIAEYDVKSTDFMRMNMILILFLFIFLNDKSWLPMIKMESCCGRQKNIKT